MSDTVQSGDLLTIQETLRYLRLDADDRRGRPSDKLRTLRRRHGLKGIKHGRHLVFRKSDLDQWLSNPNPAVKTA